MLKPNYKLALLAALTLSASAAAVAAPLVTNGGFESGYVAPGVAIPGWTLSGNNNFSGVDNPSTPGNDPNLGTGFAAHSGSWDADLGPTGTYVNGVYTAPNPGVLAQTVADTAGLASTLTFWLNSEKNTTANNFFDYSIDNTTVNLTNVAELGTYIQYSLNFISTGSDTIKFVFENDDVAFALDDVAITQVPSVATTPEPSSLMLLGTGVLAAAGVARRKFLAV